MEYTLTDCLKKQDQLRLSIRAELDENEYPTGVKVSDAELAGVRIRRSGFHGDWNYVVSPNGEAKS